MTDDRLGQALLTLARGAIGMRFGGPQPPVAGDPELDAPGATFVTLKAHGELRGCIGSLTPQRPLREDVMRNAVNAAFGDPRFPPLTRDELETLEVEVSRLSEPEPIACEDEASVIAALRPHVDGVVLAFGAHRSTFLPQVWEMLPDAGRFLGELKRKAGLPADFWHDDVQVARYTVTRWTTGDGAARDAVSRDAMPPDAAKGQRA